MELMAQLNSVGWGQSNSRLFISLIHQVNGQGICKAPMLVGVGRVSLGAAMPSGAGGSCQEMSGSDKSTCLIGQGADSAIGAISESSIDPAGNSSILPVHHGPPCSLLFSGPNEQEYEYLINDNVDENQTTTNHHGLQDQGMRP